MRLILALASLLFMHADAFFVGRIQNSDLLKRKSLWLSDSSPELEAMRLRDIQAELKSKGISFEDCFDKESLMVRLRDVREGKIQEKNPPGAREGKSMLEEKNASTTASSSEISLDIEQLGSKLRKKALKELKTECSQRSLRYATFLEKEDFVQAILSDMKKVASFSVSGALRPGKASEITGEQLDQEMTSNDTPILLDVYATWCGPCKMMAPELEKAAEELGTKCRVAKLDSDKFPSWAGKYEVQGLPTVLVIQNMEVKGRLEGAVMKDKLVELAMAG